MTTKVKDGLKGYCAHEWGQYGFHTIEAARPVKLFSAAADNYQPENAAHAAEGAYRHKRHTFKLCQCAVTRGGLFCLDECGMHVYVFVWNGRWRRRETGVNEVRNNAEGDKQQPKAVFVLPEEGLKSPHTADS